MLAHARQSVADLPRRRDGPGLGQDSQVMEQERGVAAIERALDDPRLAAMAFGTEARQILWRIRRLFRLPETAGNRVIHGEGLPQDTARAALVALLGADRLTPRLPPLPVSDCLFWAVPEGRAGLLLGPALAEATEHLLAAE